MDEFLSALWNALMWFLEGLLGSFSAMVAVHTDVPTLQCLASSLILLAIVVPIDIFIFDKIKKKKRLRNQDEGEER
jgi:hypothetical protein